VSPEIQHNKHPKFSPNGLIITNQSFCHIDVVQSFQNNGIKVTETSTPWEASHDAFSRHPPPTQAPSRAGSLRATHHQRDYLEQQIIARLSILILSKIYPSVITTSPTLDMKGFLATGFLLLKVTRICPYFQDFSTSSSGFTLLDWPASTDKVVQYN
jgi:hypothetical protein